MKIIMKNKKATSHIEIVLSFVIFIGFLVFFIAVFNPFNFSKETYAEANKAEIKVRESVSTGLDFVSLKLDKTEAKCFSFDYDFKKQGNVFVKDKDKNSIISNYDSENKKVFIGQSENLFFYIYFSPEFSMQNELQGCKELKEDLDRYKLGLLVEQIVISHKKLTELEDKYANNYQSLKDEFGLSSDFAVKVIDYLTGGEIIGTLGEKPKNARVYVKETPVQIVYETGEIKGGILHVEVW